MKNKSQNKNKRNNSKILEDLEIPQVKKSIKPGWLSKILLVILDVTK